MADWAGDFGREYTIRNAQLADRTLFFKRFLKYGITNVFEIGCNIGTNLKVFEKFDIEAMGCDINAYAVEVAVLNGLKAYVEDGTYLHNDTFDFVFTVGVLIHQQTAELIKMMKNMVKMSSRYVMFAEYEGTDEEVPYRDQKSALFKREFGKIFEAIFPQAISVERGTAGRELGFDNVTYWMYDISSCASSVKLETPAGKSLEESEGETFTVVSATQAYTVGVN